MSCPKPEGNTPTRRRGFDLTAVVADVLNTGIRDPLVIQCEQVVYGPLSKPGVEIGTGKRSRPLPSLSNSSPNVSRHPGISRYSQRLGLIGSAKAFFQRASISSALLQPMPR